MSRIVSRCFYSAIRQYTRPIRTFSTDNEDNKDDINLSKPKTKPLADPIDSSELDRNLVNAANKVASHLTGGEGNDPLNQRKTSTDLLSRLKQMSKETEGAKRGKDDIASLFGKMKVERAEKKRTLDRSELTQEQREFLEKRRQRRRESKENVANPVVSYVKGDLFRSKTLDIFPDNFVGKSNTEELATWQKCLERDIDILMTVRPKNFLEEMIQMTEKGMLWPLPLNNEYGIDEDKMEPFYEHVFLDKYLEPWCPKTGPVRHFMELVTVGLSKNPYMSIEKKVNHLRWFQEYFTSQKQQDILKLAGVEM